MLRRRVSIALLACTALSVGYALPLVKQQTYPYQQVPIPSGPSWFDLQDIGNGVDLETSVSLTPTVIVPSTGASVRGVSFHIDFVYGVGVMQKLDYLQLHDLADTDPVNFKFIGVDRNLVVNPRTPLDTLNYNVSLSPKAGFSWGTIEGADDLSIVATQF